MPVGVVAKILLISPPHKKIWTKKFANVFWTSFFPQSSLENMRYVAPDLPKLFYFYSSHPNQQFFSHVGIGFP